MGLDNGIILHTKNKLTENDVPEYLRDIICLDEENKYYDICYWRKCWGLRSDILNILKNNIINNTDDNANNIGEYEKELTIKNINSIIELMKSYLVNPETWCDSIWEFDNDAINRIAYDIVALGWLKQYLKTHPYSYAIFYDSY